MNNEKTATFWKKLAMPLLIILSGFVILYALNPPFPQKQASQTTRPPVATSDRTESTATVDRTMLSETTSTSSATPSRTPTPSPVPSFTTSPTSSLSSASAVFPTMSTTSPTTFNLTTTSSFGGTVPVDLRPQQVYKDLLPGIVGLRIETTPEGSMIPQMFTGSGLIIDAKGIVVTFADAWSPALDNTGRLRSNAHIGVLVPGRSQKPLSATPIGRDRLTGLTVLQIEGGGPFHVPPLAEKQMLAVGEPILTIGYPDDHEKAGSLMSGSVIGLSWGWVLENGVPIQVISANSAVQEAAIGGALVNLRGDVAGLTGYSRGRADLISKSLPIESVLQIAANLQNPQQQIRNLLGIAVLNEEAVAALVARNRIPGDQPGLVVASVMNGTPAWSTALREWDIIQQINGVTVRKPSDLVDILSKAPLGGRITLRVYRPSEGKLLQPSPSLGLAMIS